MEINKHAKLSTISHGKKYQENMVKKGWKK